jgi:hypothetical protein
MEALDACFDRHERCNEFVNAGECNDRSLLSFILSSNVGTKNPGWMIINCPLGCKSCHLRDSKVRCSRERLNITDTAALIPGRLNEIFTRFVRNDNNQFGQVTVLSEDPWVVQFDDFMTVEETNAMIQVVSYWSLSSLLP